MSQENVEVLREAYAAVPGRDKALEAAGLQE